MILNYIRDPILKLYNSNKIYRFKIVERTDNKIYLIDVLEV